MKALLAVAILLFSQQLFAQYYYKDIVGTRESAALINSYLKNKVQRVGMVAYDADNQRDPDLFLEQMVQPQSLTLTTTSRSGLDNQSVLSATVNASGQLVQTRDSNSNMRATTEYTYDAQGRLLQMFTISSSIDTSFTEVEQHIWTWNGNQPANMLRIKNKKDTTFVSFKLDEAGNVAEETETRRGVTSQPVYYYYNEAKQLTDIVRFNKRAGRLLPEYMFEYSNSGQVAQKITVPDNNSQYLIWRYQYDAKGLKIKEAIYDKQKQLTGKIEYQYSFGN